MYLDPLKQKDHHNQDYHHHPDQQSSVTSQQLDPCISQAPVPLHPQLVLRPHPSHPDSLKQNLNAFPIFQLPKNRRSKTGFGIWDLPRKSFTRAKFGPFGLNWDFFGTIFAPFWDF